MRGSLQHQCSSYKDIQNLDLTMRKYKSFYKNISNVKKNTNLDQVADICAKLQGLEDKNIIKQQTGMQSLRIEQTSEAVRKYYDAFPALKKDEETTLKYFMPPPSWCKKPEVTRAQTQLEMSPSKDWNLKTKRITMGKERRNSFHGQKKSNNSKKRYNSYSKSFESKENLPEWVTHEGVWDMETQDPVKEFIKALAMDEGYGTSENTITDEIRVLSEADIKPKATVVPEWDDDINLDTEWGITDDLIPREKTPAEEDLYAKFEAKFDSSIEALWSKDQANTPDDEYQELPIDFQDLLSSPSDQRPMYGPSAEKCSMISLTESIWSNDAYDSHSGWGSHIETPTKSIEVLHDRFKPLNLADEVTQDIEPVMEDNSYSLFKSHALPAMYNIIQSLTALNHSKSQSSFTEVLPRKPKERINHIEPVDNNLSKEPVYRSTESEDLLTSSRTHFRPIRKSTIASTSEPTQYADGTTFVIDSELDTVNFTRSQSGCLYLESDSETPEMYLEYRMSNEIDYGRLNLTEEQKEANKEFLVPEAFSLRFRVCQVEKGVQTGEDVDDKKEVRWGPCDECKRLAGAKKMRQGSTLESIWSETELGCIECSRTAPPADMVAREEWSKDWEELLSDITYAHAQLSDGDEFGGNLSSGKEWWRVERKRRHSATTRCGLACNHPHAPFLQCCTVDRPLTR